MVYLRWLPLPPAPLIRCATPRSTRPPPRRTPYASLSSVDVHPSRLAGVRNIVDVVFSYTYRQTDATERFFVRVDVTEEFPFLGSQLSLFYER